MNHGCSSPRSVERRRILQACCGLALCRPLAAAADEADEASSPPQEGDFLAFAYGPRAAQPIGPEDVALDAPQVLAYPMSPLTRRVRDGTRLNQLVVVRFDPALLSAESRARSAEGVLAYSGVCTHTGCDVTDWKSDMRRFKCPCHESEFDPADGARVVGGPAPWPLAALPLKIVEGKLAVAGPFEGRVGFQQPGFETLG